MHVDCAAATAGDGTIERPLNRLADVNAITFGPGDRLLFKRGSRCSGTLAPGGAGAAGSPWLIQPYGEGTARPVIDGAGAADTVLLLNTQHVELSGLEVTNAGNPGRNKRGVHVRLSGFGTGTHYVVRDVFAHDVLGDNTKSSSGSDAILFSVTGSTPSHFEDVLIENNTVTHADRGGIRAVVSDWWQRPEVGQAVTDRPWTPSTGIVIRGNTVGDVGGDGIVVLVATGTLVERNRVSGFQRRSAGYNAGLWPWDAEGTVFQFNEASGGETTRDGMGYDVDEGTTGTVFQYNYSHDNAGGFLLLCTAGGVVRDAVVRYNVSQNDRYRGVEMCSGPIESAHVYNNTIYAGPGVSQTVINENTTARHNVRFENNIVVKEGSGTASFALKSGTAVALAANTLVNVGAAPANPGGLTADPRLTGRDAGLAGYRLYAGSPALRAGNPVAGDGGRDVYGTPLTSPPNMGAYGGAGEPGWSALTNGGFETGTLAGWATSNATITTSARTGGYAVQLRATASRAATIEQVVTGLTAGRAYRLGGFIASDGGQTLLGAKGYGGAQVTSAVTGTAWQKASVTFTPIGSSVTVFCYRPGAGTARCDDLTLTGG